MTNKKPEETSWIDAATWNKAISGPLDTNGVNEMIMKIGDVEILVPHVENPMVPNHIIDKEAMNRMFLVDFNSLPKYISSTVHIEESYDSIGIDKVTF